MKKEKLWKVTLTDDQLALINQALEFYFRTMLGQAIYVSNEVTIDAYEPLDRNAEDYKERFNARLRDRDVLYEIFNLAFKIVHGAYGTPRRQSDTILEMEDMWAVIRHARWKDRPEPKSHDTVDASEPFLRTLARPLTVERMSDGKA